MFDVWYKQNEINFCVHLNLTQRNIAHFSEKLNVNNFKAIVQYFSFNHFINIIIMAKCRQIIEFTVNFLFFLCKIFMFSLLDFPVFPFQDFPVFPLQDFSVFFARFSCFLCQIFLFSLLDFSVFFARISCFFARFLGNVLIAFSTQFNSVILYCLGSCHDLDNWNTFGSDVSMSQRVRNIFMVY